MKLLLTSAGFTNKSISNALLDLIQKPLNKLKLVFILTAQNVEEKDKGWLINDLYNCKKLGFAEIEIIDIATPEKDIWMPKLEKADILMFGGGNTFYLMNWLVKTGLDLQLKKLLRNKVYVGISAGSMVTSPDLTLSQSKKLYYENYKGKPDEKGLGFVNFLIRPHYKSSSHKYLNDNTLQKMAKKTPYKTYAIDDQSAIMVNGEKTQVISEGEWKLFS